MSAPFMRVAGMGVVRSALPASIMPNAIQPTAPLDCRAIVNVTSCLSQSVTQEINKCPPHLKVIVVEPAIVDPAGQEPAVPGVTSST